MTTSRAARTSTLLVGGPGDDRLIGSESEGSFGEDPDFAVYLDSPAPIQASLMTAAAVGDGTDSLVEIEGLTGSPFGDTLEGDAGFNILDGRAGDDRLTGMGGCDFLDGDDGNDVFDGGPGEDFASYDYAPAPVTVDLGHGIASGWGSDTITGVEDVIGSRFDDRLTGDPGRNAMFGGSGADVVSGAGGADLLRGEKAGDVLNGGPGPDRLDGGPGRDRLNGGPGRDRCVGEKKRSCP